MFRALRELALDLASFAVVAWGAHVLASTLFPQDALRGAVTTFLVMITLAGLAVSARIPPVRLVPAALVLQFLPWASSREPLVFGVAMIALLLLRLGAPDGSALVAPRHPSWRDPYSLALLVVALAMGAHHVAVARDQLTSFDNDGAYYYAVARHIAATGRLEEPLVWHFLVPQAQVVHPAFDYWQGLTSLLLVGPFALWGASHAVAATTMALVSGVVLVLLWALVTQTGLVRHRAVQLAALIAYAFTPTLARFRLDSETPCVSQLFFALALWMLARGRPLGAVLAAFPLVLTRADGTLPAALLGVVALSIARTRRQKIAIVVTGALLVAALIAFYEAHFGTLTPPAAGAGALLHEYADLYRMHATPRTLEELRDAHLAPGVFDTAIAMVRDTYAGFEFATLARQLPLLLGLASLRLVAERGTSAAVLRATLVLTAIYPFVLAWALPVVFSPYRSLHGLIPAFVLALAIGLDVGLAATARVRVSAALIEAFVVSALLMHLVSVSMLRPSDDAFRRNRTLEIQRLAPELGQSVVLTTGPWWIAAESEARTVSLPTDDLAAIEECIARYHVDYVIVGVAAYDGWPQAAVARIAAGPIGPFTLETVPHDGYYRIFRVLRPPE